MEGSGKLRMRLGDIEIDFLKCGHINYNCHLQQFGGMWQPSFSAQDLQFFASLKTSVTILPNFTKEQLYLLSGQVGPFKAGLETSVPLWLALHLKLANKCKIYQPYWFQQGYLNELSNKEKNAKNELINLNNDEFFEISYIYLSKAPDNITKVHHTRALIEGIENMRREKVRKLFEESKGSISLKNLTTYQANRIREPLSKLAAMVDRLKKSDTEKNRRQ